MARFSTLASRLAFQVDKKILELEEENYMRLDISAHEHTGAAIFALPGPSFFKQARQFAGAALLIYFALFAITNAAAYTKILMAGIQQFTITETMPETVSQTEIPLETLTDATQNNSLLALNLTPTVYENRLSIPSLNVNAPIIEPDLGIEALQTKDWNTLESQIRDTLLEGVVHYPGTAKPGKVGNAFLTGHSSNYIWEISDYNTVFALLPKIEIGADIRISYNQKEFLYRVIDKKEVKPDDVSILKQGDQKILTLMTCTPVGTTLKRLVVTAELIED